ncbi:MAG: hypothetical protein NT062_00980, partial [Proteobacteria bacterium]|nr:hypothetical protein [Pseudomonadota bacterium]
AFLQCPLALDPEAFRQSVGALDTETIPDPGTALVEAIREARMGFRQESGATRVILVMTDGERRTIVAICVLAIPLLWIALGALVIWLRRRRG